MYSVLFLHVPLQFDRETLFMLDPNSPAVILAPMEGVTDAPMRATRGECGAFRYAVTEFVRVTQSIIPRAVFLRDVPELLSATTPPATPTGLPVQVQLLGGDPERVAGSAVAAHQLGATAIDLNFGCPARKVNNHDGGAALLREPRRIRTLVAAVRAALPQHVPVSAKLRLGWDSIDTIDENAAMAAEGGAAWLTIHGRTRVAGYAPPIFWRPIGRVREQLGLPVVANGDIWSLADFRRCREETGCIHFMLGRGGFADPRLPAQIAAELGLCPRSEPFPIDWPTELSRLVYWADRTPGYPAYRLVCRMKQWLKLAADRGLFRQFDAIKRTTTVSELFAVLGGHHSGYSAVDDAGIPQIVCQG